MDAENESFWKNLWKMFSEYSNESSIHSLQYIGKENIHFVERIFWIAAFIFSFLACTLLIHQTYLKWENDPVLVTFNERATPTWKIPFPSITLCPESPVNAEKFNVKQAIFNLKNSKSNMTADDLRKLDALGQICEAFEPEILQNSSDTNYIKTLEEIAVDYMGFSYLMVAGKDFELKDRFHKIITEEGICHTFNMMDQKDLYTKSMSSHLRYPNHGVINSNWTSNGYSTDDVNAYPMRILGSGRKAAVIVYIWFRRIDIDYSCKGSASGFLLSLHTPDETPQLDSNFYKISFDAETIISVIPQAMTTSKNLVNYSPIKRQCYFPGEKILKYFKHYSQSNCNLECLSEYFQEKCGCVKFWMPRTEGSKTCGNSKKNCIIDAERSWILKKNTGYKGDRKATQLCQCLPSCSSIHYNGEVSQSNFDVERHYEANQIFYSGENDTSLWTYARILIYFKEDHFIESKRSELYGWTNFLSSCGGFLGLLMGGSLLSLIEIFYHLTLKRIFKERNDAKSVENRDVEAGLEAEN